MLAAVQGRLPTDVIKRLRNAVATNDGLPIPEAGPLSIIVSSGQHLTSDFAAAVQLPPGQRPVRSAVWSPLPLTSLPLTRYKARSKGEHALPQLRGRWRVPEFSEVEP